MGQCSNCYGGCIETVSDKCVKYTGLSVPAFDIQNGDSLSYVEQALITFLASTLNGSGITITIPEEDYCTLVSGYLQSCSTVTALDLFKALVKAACNLQEQIDTESARIDTIEAAYSVSCLSGVTSGSGTHAIVQAIITKLCSINTDLANLATDVDTNYVKIADINSYIAAYIASTTSATRYYTRMVPYAITMYSGSLSYFDATGAGITATEWEKIYLCNGNNGTPDLRGRVPVGAINGVPGGAMSAAVNPASDPTFNPNYSLGDVQGANKQTLSTSQIPSHNHTLTDPGHTHILATDEDVTAGTQVGPDEYIPATSTTGVDIEYSLVGASLPTPTVGKVLENTTGISLADTGGGAAHDNKQPVIALYFIIYIP